MTCSRQCASSVQCLVYGASVAVVKHDVHSLRWLQPNVRHHCEQLLGGRLGKLIDFCVPSATLQEQTVDIHSILWCNFLVKLVLFGEDLEVDLDLINWDDILPGVVLLHTCQERLSKEETGDPEALWRSFINPLLHEDQTFNKVHNVRGQWLKRWVRTLHPGCRGPVVKD